MSHRNPQTRRTVLAINHATLYLTQARLELEAAPYLTYGDLQTLEQLLNTIRATLNAILSQQLAVASSAPEPGTLDLT